MDSCYKSTGLQGLQGCKEQGYSGYRQHAERKCLTAAWPTRGRRICIFSTLVVQRSCSFHIIVVHFSYMLASRVATQEISGHTRDLLRGHTSDLLCGHARDLMRGHTRDVPPWSSCRWLPVGLSLLTQVSQMNQQASESEVARWSELQRLPDSQNQACQIQPESLSSTQNDLAPWNA